MAVVYASTVKDSRMTAVRDAVCGGTSGTLEMLTSGDALLVTHTLTTAGGSVTSGVWTLAFTSTTAAAIAGGTAAKAQIKNNGGTALITGLTVGTGGTDVVLDNTSIGNGQNVTISSATITHAA